MARPRKPDAVKAANGTLRADRKVDEMKATPGVAKFSETNVVSEKLAYEKLTEMFNLSGIVGREDSLALRQLAYALYRWHYAKDIVDEVGPYYKVKTTQGEITTKETAASKDLKEWDRKLSEHLAKFGASPAARAAVAKIQADTDASTKLLEMFTSNYGASGKQADMFGAPPELAERAVN